MIVKKRVKVVILVLVLFVMLMSVGAATFPLAAAGGFQIVIDPGEEIPFSEGTGTGDSSENTGTEDNSACSDSSCMSTDLEPSPTETFYLGWLPPITNEDFALYYGTNLPIKFQLYDDNLSLIVEQMPIYITVTGPNGFSVIYSLGSGENPLTWSGEPDYLYQANFDTKDFEGQLVDGGIYTVTVYFIPPAGQVVPIGSISFDLFLSRGTNRSNS